MRTRILFLYLAMLLQALPALAFSGGDGTAKTPYQISTRSDLESLSSYLGAAHANKHFEIKNDIDLGSAMWEPIGGIDYDDPDVCFMGTLNGGGHIIRNMHIEGAQTAHVALGLFTSLHPGAHIENVRLENARIVVGEVDTVNFVGLLAGQVSVNDVDSTVIRNCSATGTIVALSSSITGGLIGDVGSAVLANFLRIAACSYSGSIIAAPTIGGLIGRSQVAGEGTTITDCYSVADIRYTGEDNNKAPVGGLVGSTLSLFTLSISRCYAGGTIMPYSEAFNKASVSGLVGIISDIEHPPFIGTISISQSVAAQSSLRFGDGALLRIVNNMSDSITPTLSDNYAYDSMKLDESAASTMIAQDLPNGGNKSLAELGTPSTYDAMGWNFSGALWTLRADHQALPYFAWQSAPALINDVLYREVSVNIANAQTDSVVAYKGAKRMRVAAMVAPPVGNIALAFDNVENGDTIFVVVYEKGKASSYCTWGVAHEAKGSGTAEDPYQIWARSDLENLRQPSHIGRHDSAVHYRIMTDIDLGGADWVPIGKSDNDGKAIDSAFRGKLHGGGHRLNNIRINTSSIVHVGLFGAIANDALIDSLHLVGGSITSRINGWEKRASVGALVGVVVGDSAENSSPINIIACTNSATVSGVDRYSNTGGLVGIIYSFVDVNISACANFGDVTGKGNYTGGIVGFTDIFLPAQLSLTDTYCRATVRSTTSTQPSTAIEVGGIFGHLNAKSSINVANCYAMGRIQADTTIHSAAVGGIIGSSAGAVTLNNAVALYDFIGTTIDTCRRHRLVGDKKSSTVITGGLAYDSLKINGNAVSGGTSSNENGQNTSLFDLMLADTYTGWDFSDSTGAWNIRDNRKSLPFLRCQTATPVIDHLYRGAHIGPVNLLYKADSVVMFKLTGERLGVTVPKSAGDCEFPPEIAQESDSIFVIAYEAGKAPSIAVQAVVKAPPAPLEGTYVVNKTGNTDGKVDTLTFADAREAIAYGGVEGDLTLRIAEGEYTQLVDPFISFSDKSVKGNRRITIEGIGKVTLRYASAANVGVRHIVANDTMSLDISNLTLIGPNSGSPSDAWATGGGVEFDTSAVGTIRLHRLNITGCRADSIGGAVCIQARAASSSLLMDACNLVNNYAGASGGALYTVPSGDIYLSDIVGNCAAQGAGGGVRAENVQLFGCIVAGNTSFDTAWVSDNVTATVSSNAATTAAYNVLADTAKYSDIFGTTTPAINNDGMMMPQINGLANNIIPAASLAAWAQSGISTAVDMRDTVRPQNTQNAGWADAGTVELLDTCSITTPTIAAEGSTTVCDGEAVRLTTPRSKSRTAKYTWIRNNSDYTTTGEPEYGATQTGTYTVKVADNVCESSATQSVSVTIQPRPGRPNLLSTGNTCEDSTLTFSTDSVSAKYTYSWIRPNVDTVPEASSISKTALGSYTYALRVKSTDNECWSETSGTVSATIFPRPSTPNLYAANACKGDTLIFATDSVQEGASYRWLFGVTNETTVTAEPRIPIFSVGTYPYRVQRSLNGCWSNESGTVTARMYDTPQKPAIKVSPALSVMFSDTLRFSTDADTSTKQYEWMRPGVDTLVSTDRTVIQTAMGDYTYVLRVQQAEAGANVDCWSAPSTPVTAHITELITEADTSTRVAITVSKTTLDSARNVFVVNNAQVPPYDVVVRITPAFDSVTVLHHGDSISEYNVNVERGGTHTDSITVISRNGRWRRLYIVAIEKQVNFDNYAVVKFGSSLLLLHKQKFTDEGFDVQDCRWYRGSEEVTKSGSEFAYSEGTDRQKQLRTGVAYRFEVLTSEGVVRSTPKIFDAPAQSEALTIAYPNPVPAGAAVMLDFGSEAESTTSEVELYSATGMLLKKFSVSGRSASIDLALPAGIYLMKVNGRSLRLVVQ